MGIGPMQSQGNVLSWSQPSYSKLSVRNVQQIDKYMYVSALSFLYYMYILAASV